MLTLSWSQDEIQSSDQGKEILYQPTTHIPHISAPYPPSLCRFTPQHKSSSNDVDD